MSGKELRRNIAKLFQLIFFTAFFFCGSNLLMKYMSLTVKSVKYGKDIPKDYFEFKTSYLYSGLNTPPVMTLGICFLLACFAVIRLDQMWQVKNGNKNIKSDDRWINKKELKENFEVVKNDDFENAEHGGIIVHYEGKKIYIDIENIHNLIIGTTRSGKGQTIILPLMNNIMRCKNKQSFIANDMKGELLENTYQTAIDNNYEIFVLNLDDAGHSDEWDCLYYIKQEYVKAQDAEEPDLSATMKLIESLGHLLTDNPKSDPIWPDSARNLLVAMILYMLEQGYKNDNLDKVTMPSVNHFFMNYGAYDEIRGKQKINALDEIFRQLPPDSPAKSAYAGSNFAKGEMRASIFSTLASNISLFGTDMGVQKITSGNTIDFSKIISEDKPCGIYIVLPDEDRSRDVIASLFVNQVYDYLAKKAKSYPNKYLSRRVRFILDEFGNMPNIPAMDNKVSIGAGHNIIFDLVIQDLNFLDNRYGKMAKSIRGTIGNLIYINSIDPDTNRYISTVLGNEQYELKNYSGNLREWLKHQNITQETKPLLSPTQLGRLKKGRAVIIRQRNFPIYAKLKFYYKYKLPIIPITEIPLHTITRTVKDSLYPIVQFQSSIGMQVISTGGGMGSGFIMPETEPDIDYIDTETENNSAEMLVNDVFEKINQLTNNSFEEQMRNGDFENAEQTLQKQYKLKKLSDEEYNIASSELSQYL